MIKGAIKSDKGFYVGDICYALAEDVYHGVWGGAGYEDGKHTDPATGREFIVAGTADGDGEYNDQTGRLYPVDAGNIGIVPLELLDEGGFASLSDKLQDEPLGLIVQTPGEATFEAESGVFDITLPGDRSVIINTADLGSDFADDEDEYEPEYWWQKY